MKVIFYGFEKEKVRCLNCGNGDDSTAEEYRKYLDELYASSNLVVNQNVLTENPCENCGCNMMSVTAIVKLKLE